MLLLFLGLGIVLQFLHGFKIQWYLEVGNETRRLLWTLAHTHGTLLSLIHLVFAVTTRMTPAGDAGRRRLASSCLMSSSVLLPGGFLLGGIFLRAGDPGVGVLLVPVGGVLLLGAVLLIAWDARP